MGIIEDDFISGKSTRIIYDGSSRLERGPTGGGAKSTQLLGCHAVQTVAPVSAADIR